MSDWFIPLWTTIAGGIIVIVFQRTYRGISAWQESRRTMDQKDRRLLYEMRDVLMDKAPGVFTKSSKGLVSQVADLSDKVKGLDDSVQQIGGKVQQVLDRIPPSP